jgi:hypothetical protein
MRAELVEQPKYKFDIQYGTSTVRLPPQVFGHHGCFDYQLAENCSAGSRLTINGDSLMNQFL